MWSGEYETPHSLVPRVTWVGAQWLSVSLEASAVGHSGYGDHGDHDEYGDDDHCKQRVGLDQGDDSHRDWSLSEVHSCTSSLDER